MGSYSDILICHGTYDGIGSDLMAIKLIKECYCLSRALRLPNGGRDLVYPEFL